MTALRTLVSVIVLPGTAMVLLPWLILRELAPPSGASWIGVVPLAIGIALSLWCVALFASRGRGTPAPWDPPRRFVAVGPYRLVRNPMYIAAALVIAGEAMLFASWALAFYLVAACVVWHFVVTAYEEPKLEREFGDEYREYRAHVPRWLPRP